MNRHVHLIDDEPHVLDAIKLLLETEGFTVSPWSSVDGFLEDPASAPGCIVSDVRMAGTSGLELLAILAERKDARPVVLLTGHGDIAMAVQALKRGAFDFLEKPFRNEALVSTIEAALTKALAETHVANERLSIRARYDSLSERQRDTMHLLIKGLSSKEIAKRLTISPRTVEVHRTWVMNKMAAKTLVDLVHMGLSLGIARDTPETDVGPT